MILRGVYIKDPIIYDDGTMCGDIYTVDQYLEMVADHSLIDYDGFGHPMKDGKEDGQLWLYPSEGRNHIPFDATHVIWFNR